MISALEKKCHVSVAHPKKLLMWLVWLVLVVHFINLYSRYCTESITTTWIKLSQVITIVPYEEENLKFSKPDKKGVSEAGLNEPKVIQVCLSFICKAVTIEGNSPDWDENDADLCVPGGSRMSRYLDTIRTEMKYNSAKERNCACLVSSTSLEQEFSFSFFYKTRYQSRDNITKNYHCTDTKVLV